MNRSRRVLVLMVPLAIVLSAGMLRGSTLPDGADLSDAARNGDEVSLRALLASGADADAEDEAGVTPLFWAAYQGRAHIVRILIDAGADVNAAMRAGAVRTTGDDQLEIARVDGWTALMGAASRGHLDIVRLLIESGAAAFQSGEDGSTALTLAEGSGHQEVYALLTGEAQPRVRECVEGLRSRYKVDRAAAADALGDMGPSAEGAVGALAEALRDDEWRVRKAASLALARIGPASNAVLVAALNDSDANLCVLAAQALGKIGPPARDAVPALIERLDHSSYSVKEEVILALGEIGDTSAVTSLSQLSKQKGSSYASQDAKKAIDAILLSEKSTLKKGQADLAEGEPDAQLLSIRNLVDLLRKRLALVEASPDLFQEIGKYEPQLRRISEEDGNPLIREKASEALAVLLEKRSALAERNASPLVQKKASEGLVIRTETGKSSGPVAVAAEPGFVHAGGTKSVLQRFLVETQGDEDRRRLRQAESSDEGTEGLKALLEEIQWDLRIGEVRRKLKDLEKNKDPLIRESAKEALDHLSKAASGKMVVTAETRAALEAIAGRLKGDEGVPADEPMEEFDIEYKPHPTKIVTPEYPQKARKKKLTGTVVLRVLITREGQVEKVEVVSGDEVFIDAAVAAARQFRFRPGKHKGVKRKVWMEMPIDFRPK